MQLRVCSQQKDRTMLRLSGERTEVEWCLVGQAGKEALVATGVQLCGRVSGGSVCFVSDLLGPGWAWELVLSRSATSTEGLIATAESSRNALESVCAQSPRSWLFM